MSSETFPRYYLLSFFCLFKVAQPLLSLQLIELSCNPTTSTFCPCKPLMGSSPPLEAKLRGKRQFIVSQTAFLFAFPFSSSLHPQSPKSTKLLCQIFYLHSWEKFFQQKRARRCCAHDSWKNIYLDTFTQSFFIRLEWIFFPSAQNEFQLLDFFRLIFRRPQFIFIRQTDRRLSPRWTQHEKKYRKILNAHMSENEIWRKYFLMVLL